MLSYITWLLSEVEITHIPTIYLDWNTDLSPILKSLVSIELRKHEIRSIARGYLFSELHATIK